MPLSQKEVDAAMRPPFHTLPAATCNSMRVLRERPPICLLPDLLSADECQRLIAKAEASEMARQTFDDSTTSGLRTSSGCVLRNEEVPTLRERFARFAGVALSQLQPLKVSRYAPGERFDAHTDAIRGDARGAPPRADDYWDDLGRTR